VHVNLAVNLDAGDSVAAVSYWFDSNTGGATCVALDGGAVTNSTKGHISGMSTGGFDITAPSDTTTTTHDLYYRVSESSDCTTGVGSVQPDSDSSHTHLRVKVVVPPVVAPTLTVTTVVSGGTAQPGDFDIFLDGAAITSGTATTTTVGAHVVSETASSTYSTVISGACDAGGNITLASGDVKTCTFTNTFIAPVAVVTASDQTVSTAENTPVSITLAGTDSIAANTLTFATSSTPANGALATTSDPATFTYTPSTGFTGGDSFTFTAGDGTATSTGTVTITITAPAGGGSSGGGSTPAVTTNNGGGGVISGPLSVGFVNTDPTGQSQGGQVLGAETDTPASCSLYLTGYLKEGSTDSASIKKLQIFLNSNLGINLPVTGVFGPLTEAAVEQFQTKYSDDILKPWYDQGFSKDMQPSGYVYKTTLREINMLNCASLEIPQPQLP
jgi:hypothetical protein